MLNVTALVAKAYATPALMTDAEINGIKFKFGALSNKDEFAIADILTKSRNSGDDMVAAMSDVRIRTISASLRAVNGEEFPEAVLAENGDKVERTAYFAGELVKWPSSLIATMFDIVNDFREHVRKSVRDTVKYEWFGEDLIKKAKEEEMLEAEEALKNKSDDIVLTQLNIPSTDEAT